MGCESIALRTNMKDFGIKGAALEVYSLIYSFTVGTYGLFFGRKEYISKELKMNIRTVYKALAKLRAFDLIENYDDGVHSGIRVKIEQNKVAAECCEKNENLAAKESGTANSAEQEERVDTRLKNSDHRANSPSSFSSRFDARGRASDREDGADKEYSLFEKIASEASLTPKFNLVKIPRNDYLTLSEPQYRELLRLVSPEVLNSYMRRFEMLLEKNLNDGGKTPHSHYKVIRKWILDDLGSVN